MEKRGALIMLNTGKQTIIDVSVGAVDTMNTNKQNVFDSGNASASPSLPAFIDAGKQNVLGIRVDAVDYEAAVNKIIGAAQHQKKLSVSALAVHGVMTGVLDQTHRYRLNR